jgi:two-component system, sensor histidine kinase
MGPSSAPMPEPPATEPAGPERTAPVLCLAPTSADAVILERLFAAAQLPAEVFADPMAFSAALAADCGALLIAEEALDGPAAGPLRARLAAQEDWSAIPLIILVASLPWTRGGTLQEQADYARITLLERPIRLATLTAVMQMARTERLQQYRVRDLLAERALGIARRDDFLALLGHEMRNPLGALSMCAEILGQEPSGPHAGQCIALIQNQAADIKRLLDDLLDISRITRGQLTLHPEPADLGDILRAVITQVQHHIEKRQQQLRTRLVPVPLPLQADPMRLRQAFINLIQNASRYSPEGSTLELELDWTDGQAIVRVRDPGVGMAPETLARIFEPFFRGGERTGGGLGVGLPLAQQLVQMHHGTLEARSAGLGHGSEFVVRLPVAPPASPRAIAP